MKYKDYDIFLMNSAEDKKKFYAEMGEFFVRADVRKDLDGYPLNNTDERLWYVAYCHDKPIGFRSFEIHGEKAEYGDAWVDPEHRGKSLYNKMLELSIAYTKDHGAKYINAIGNANSTPALKKHGFEIYRKRGRFNYMRLVVGE